MSTSEVANSFYALAQQGNWDNILETLFSPEAMSVEPAHAQGLATVQGLGKIREKGKKWAGMIEQVHGGYCHEPVVVGNHFACAMGVDATMKGQGRQKLDELAVYEVKDGKIVLEHFFY